MSPNVERLRALGGKLTAAEAAKALGVHVGVIYRAHDAWGVPYKKWHNITDEEMPRVLELLFRFNLNLSDVGRRYGCSHHVVKRHANKYLSHFGIVGI